MIRLRRLAKIVRVVGKYRLDELLDKDNLPFTVRAALAPAVLFGKAKNKANRGERLRLALEELGPIFIKFGADIAGYQVWSSRQQLTELNKNRP